MERSVVHWVDRYYLLRGRTYGLSFMSLHTHCWLAQPSLDASRWLQATHCYCNMSSYGYWILCRCLLPWSWCVQMVTEHNNGWLLWEIRHHVPAAVASSSSQISWKKRKQQWSETLWGLFLPFWIGSFVVAHIIFKFHFCKLSSFLYFQFVYLV